MSKAKVANGDMANKATERLGKTRQDAYRADEEHAVEVQERDARFAQHLMEVSIRGSCVSRRRGSWR